MTAGGINSAARHAARLAAVQAIYQMELTALDAEAVIDEFCEHRFAELAPSARPDAEFFADVVRGVPRRQTDIDRAIARHLAQDWKFSRIDSILRAILRAGGYELIARSDVPAKVVIDEYLDITHAFFQGDEPSFVNRTTELARLVRDLSDGQKVFLLSPRRFGKSSLVGLALLKLKKRHIHAVSLTVSSYSNYAQFLEKFAEKVLRAAGPWDRVKDWVTRFGRNVKPDINYNMTTGEISVSLGKGAGFDPTPIAPEVFAMPGELTKNAGFRMAICLDEFQQISEFDSGSVENAIRNQVQEQ